MGPISPQERRDGGEMGGRMQKSLSHGEYDAHIALLTIQFNLITRVLLKIIY